MSKGYLAVGFGHPKTFDNVRDAVNEAVVMAKKSMSQSVTWVTCLDRQLVVCVVSDDANGVTVHKLAPYPKK